MSSNLPQSKFHIIQSNDIHRLFSYLLTDYKNKSSHIFEPFIVIVPSKVMGDWLKKQVADQTGISTLVTAEFWGRYQWTLMQQVLQEYAKFEPRKALRVPEVAVLSKNVMQWRLFGYFNAEKNLILADPTHPLYPLLEPLIGMSAANKHHFTPIQTPFSLSPVVKKNYPWLRQTSFIHKNNSTTANKSRIYPRSNQVSSSSAEDFKHASDDQRLWQLASDMASMLSRYMTYRPNWLASWANKQAVNVEALVAEKDKLNWQMLGITDETAEDTPRTPDWLIAHYKQLEAAQQHLWQVLFADTYQYREKIVAQFWHALEHPNAQIAHACRQTLPKQLTLFTIQQLPKSELEMMEKLARFTYIKLLHYNPSEMFWADIVDKNWLTQQTFINPNAMYARDHGHTLLSRFGKQSREVFAMLADFSGNDSDILGHVTWEDDFVSVIDESDANNQMPSLLNRLQQDILMLQETKDNSRETVEKLLKEIDKREYKPERPWQLSQIDNSLSIHSCHSMVRQLEVLRAMIIGWLNYADKPYLFEELTQVKEIIGNSVTENLKKSPLSLSDAVAKAVLKNKSLENHPTIQFILNHPRLLSDILVLVPDIEAQQAVIESIFPKGVGTDGYDLPAKVTGVTSKDINQLWSAITGFFTLLQPTQHATATNTSTAGQVSGQSVARFDRASVFDWLMLPPLVESYGLTHEQMRRGCELLELAGFARGFDERHLATTLHESDDDYRYSFVYALERLVAGLLMPNAQTTQFGEYINRFGKPEKILPLAQVQMGDSAVIAVLCDIFATIDRLRDVGKKTATAGNWLLAFERFIKEKFEIFMQTNALNSIWAALNAFKKNNEANQRYTKSQSYSNHTSDQPTAPRIDPDKLPLKLGFILASIESELASQQVSAEPSGVITFGRIGAVRNLPYKLVVMLNMNLSNFPNRDKANRYDLMQAGVNKRGDRFKEDDELGAFLDALLSAKEACWLFYNGASTSDSHEHLPASPVAELIDFLQEDVSWQIDSNANVMNNHAADFIKEWLITHHPELPFEAQYFYTPMLEEDETTTEQDKLTYHINQMKHAQKSLYPPAPLWYTVFSEVYLAPNTNHPKNHANQAIEILPKNTLIASLNHWQQQQQNTPSAQKQDLATQYTNLSHLIRALQQPAKTYLNAQQIHLSQYEQDGQNIEPIELDNLGKYHINANLLEEKLLKGKLTDAQDKTAALNALVFSNELPAGVSRYASIDAHRQKIDYDTQVFLEKLQNLQHMGFATAANLIQTLITNKGDLANSSNLADIITPCQEQRFSVVISDVQVPTDSLEKSQIKAKDTLESAPAIWQNWVITANFPTLNHQHPKEKPIDTGYWINYLPTSGREKYRLQFWLMHLAWQVARGTTPQQVSEGNGFSLWQFNDKVTLYLAPIAYTHAYAWLQDWLVFWQFSQQHAAILPPSVALKTLSDMYPVSTNTTASKSKKAPPDIYTALNKTNWKTTNFNQDDVIYEDEPRHEEWQFLLKDKDPIQAIIPFIETWGKHLYLPILEHIKEVQSTTIVTEQDPQ